MAVRNDLTVIIVGVDRRNSVAVRVGQGGQSPRHHLQMVQGKIFHAVELCRDRQQAVFVPRNAVHHHVQLLGGEPLALGGTVVVLGDELLDPTDLAVDASALGNATLALNSINGILGKGGVGAEQVAALELTGVRHHEIGSGVMGHKLVQVKPAGEGGGKGEQH